MTMISPSHFHIVSYEVASEGAGSMIVLGGWATGTGQYTLRTSISIRSVKLQDHYTIPYQLPHQKQAESGSMVSLVLWDISFQERQGRVSPWSPHKRRDQRRRWWRKEWRLVPSCRAGRVPKRSRWEGKPVVEQGQRTLYSTDVVVGNLNRETGRE
jgi:hypothetical protein